MCYQVEVMYSLVCASDGGIGGNVAVDVQCPSVQIWQMGAFVTGTGNSGG